MTNAHESKTVNSKPLPPMHHGLPAEVRQNILNRVDHDQIRTLARTQLSLFRGFSTVSYFMQNGEIASVVNLSEEDVAMACVDRWWRAQSDRAKAGNGFEAMDFKDESLFIVRAAIEKQYWKLLDWILSNQKFPMAAQLIGWALLNRVWQLEGCPIAVDLLLRHFGRAKIWPGVREEIEFTEYSLYSGACWLPEYYQKRAAELHWDEALLCVAAERGLPDLATKVLEQRFPNGGSLTAEDCADKDGFGRRALKRMCKDPRLVTVFHRYGFHHYQKLWYRTFDMRAKHPITRDAFIAFLQTGIHVADYERVMRRPIRSLLDNTKDAQWRADLPHLLYEYGIRIDHRERSEFYSDDSGSTWSLSDDDEMDYMHAGPAWDDDPVDFMW